MSNKKTADKEPATIQKQFKTDDTEYTGQMYTIADEYFQVLATKHGKDVEEVANSIVLGYQALQMTRVAQARKKSKDGLKDGDVVEVMSLYGTKTSKWGDLAKFVPMAKDKLKELVASEEHKLTKEEVDDALVRKFAAAYKTKFEEDDSFLDL